MQTMRIRLCDNWSSRQFELDEQTGWETATQRDDAIQANCREI